MAKKKTNSVHNSYSATAIASFIFGILFLTPFIGGLFGLGAMIAGFRALHQIKKHGQKGKGLAVAGIVLGGIGVFGMITFYGLLIVGLMSLR